MSQPFSRFWTHNIPTNAQGSSIFNSQSSYSSCLVEIWVGLKDEFVAYLCDVFGIIETFNVE